MGVINLLKEQDAGFISLHEVLTQLTQIDGASYQEAAVLLHRLLWAETKNDRPRWHVSSLLYGDQLAGDVDERNAWECLRQAARSGSPAEMSRENEIPF